MTHRRHPTVQPARRRRRPDRGRDRHLAGPARGQPWPSTRSSCEIETAKSLVELPQPVRGSRRGAAGRGRGDGRLSARRSSPWTPAVPRASRGLSLLPPQPRRNRAAEEKREPVLVGYGWRSKAGPPSAGRRGRTALGACRPPTAPAPCTGVLAKPPVRKLAKDLGVDLRTVVPGGPTGSSPERMCGGGAAAAALRAPRAEPRRPHRLRRCARAGRAGTADAGQGGAQGHGGGDGGAVRSPHRTSPSFCTVDVTETVKVVAGAEGGRSSPDVKVSPLLLVARALLIAVRRHPEINASWDEAAQEIVDQALREPGHRGGHAAGPGGAEHQGRRLADAGRTWPGR